MVFAAVGTFALSSAAEPARARQGPSDAQIVGIILAADQIDIDYGKIALQKIGIRQSPLRPFNGRWQLNFKHSLPFRLGADVC